MHRRTIAALAAAGLCLLLAASPVAALAPANPAAGHWAAIGTAPYPTIVGGVGNVVWGSKVGPDGKLYVYGSFTAAAGDPTASNLAVYDPATGSWSGLGSNGVGGPALGGFVYDVAWFNGTLYAAGNFTNAGGVTGADYLAAWNGTSWTRRGGSSALNGPVLRLGVAGGALYAGGSFTNAGGDATADYVAYFDGYHWHGVGSNGSGNGALTDVVYGMQLLPDGRVFAAGAFTNDGPGNRCDHICWFDPGSESWNPVGGVAGPDNAFNGTINNVLVVGSLVYVAGDFTDAGGNTKADEVAVWNGAAWTNLGSNAAGTDGAITGAALGLAVYGSNVIVSGNFGNAGGVPGAAGVAVFNGATWLALGQPNVDAPPFTVNVVGRVLYVSGLFSAVAGVPNTAGIAAYGLPGVASAPRSLAATSGARRVMLAWSAPATTNASGAVRDYVVQYRRSGTTAWKTFADGVKTTRTAVVTGLVKGTTYQFRVLAKTDWGIGASSAIVTKRAG